jgi:hypothetical protein
MCIKESPLHSKAFACQNCRKERNIVGKKGKVKGRIEE